MHPTFVVHTPRMIMTSLCSRPPGRAPKRVAKLRNYIVKTLSHELTSSKTLDLFFFWWCCTAPSCDWNMKWYDLAESKQKLCSSSAATPSVWYESKFKDCTEAFWETPRWSWGNLHICTRLKCRVCLYPAVWFCLTALALLLLGLCDMSVKLWVLLVQRKYSSFLLSAAASCPEARALFYLTDYSLQMQTETWVCFSDPAAEWATAQRAPRWYQKLMSEQRKAHISVSTLHESFTNQCLIPLCSFTICF